MGLPHGLDLVFVFIGFAVLVASLSVHEAAHAWTADKLGDPTARMLGRVSLNPARHVDPIGTINLSATDLWNVRFAKRIRQPTPSREETT